MTLIIQCSRTKLKLAILNWVRQKDDKIYTETENLTADPSYNKTWSSIVTLKSVKYRDFIIQTYGNGSDKEKDTYNGAFFSQPKRRLPLQRHKILVN